MMEPVLFTIIHSCEGTSKRDMELLTRLYQGRGYVSDWMPGKPNTQGAVHFTVACPGSQRNGIENWEGGRVRFISILTAQIELSKQGSIQ
tara:strand:+ start:1406 stop:1675 length:270 start_codon:yes stop_codon:yes gene_type:complete